MIDEQLVLLKIQCLEAALKTTASTDGMQFNLNGADEVVAAAKKYYEFINGEKTNAD